MGTKISKDMLVDAAKDLNTIFEDEPIKVNTKSTSDSLTEGIKAVIDQLQDGDELNQSTVDLLIELECDVPGKIKIRKTAKEKSAPKSKSNGEKKAPGEPSNKSVVYSFWKKGEVDVIKLRKAVKENVKENTIKIWIQAWKNGKNLPASAQ